MAAAEPLRLTVARCALDSAVICTTVATDELQLAVNLGRTARAAGFGCIAVLPFDAVAADGLDASDRGLLALLPPPTPPLLPRPQFCGKQYLSRRRQFHRMRLWRMLLEAGFHVLIAFIVQPFIVQPPPTRIDAREHGALARSPRSTAS